VSWDKPRVWTASGILSLAIVPTALPGFVLGYV